MDLAINVAAGFLVFMLIDLSAYFFRMLRMAFQLPVSHIGRSV